MYIKLAVAAVAVMLVAYPGESEAKRFGVRVSSTPKTTSPSYSVPTIRVHTNSSSGSPSGNALATGTVPYGSGSVSKNAAQALEPMSPEEARRRAEKQAEDERLAKIADDQRKAAQEKEKAEQERLAAIGAAEREKQERAEKAEALRIAKLEAEQERARKQLEKERQCKILPVMTDAEIAFCKEVWR